MIDTHCHLNDPEFAGEETQVVERAKAAGVVACLVAGYDKDSCNKALELASIDGVYTALGIHPHDSGNINIHPDWLQQLKSSLESCSKVCAVGEIGLDFHYSYSNVESQEHVFRQQIRLAATLDLPVTVHSRSAEDKVMDIFHEEGTPPAGVVLHAFTGTKSQMDRALGMGFYIGVGGMVTFKNADELRQTIRAAPLDRIVLETDSPYLAPVPLRGKTNEPANIRFIVPALAALFQISESDIEHITDENASRVFTRMGA